MSVPRLRCASSLLLAIVLILAIPLTVSGQNGTVTGQVVDENTRQGLSSVQVYIPDLDLGVLSQDNGRYLLLNVPPGTYSVRAERIGYRGMTQQVTVGAGETAVADFLMGQQPLSLEEIVVTGLVDPVEGVRAPITIGHVDRDMMPVAISSGAVIENVAGKVAGVRVNRVSGQPGAGVTMMLRSPTSLRAGGAPLIVVDGVILGGGGLAGDGLPPTVDLDGMDIESIEVIRGAAASSLYGSRAAAGVIAITTARGDALPQGETRFMARSEYGRSQNVRMVDLNNSHAFLMDPSNTQYVDALGNPVSRNDRELPDLDVAFMDKPFPGGVYDNIGAITHGGGFLSNNLSILGNEGSTNFAVTFNNLQEEGILRGNEGYTRNSFRVNVDHRFLESMTLGVSMYHSRDSRDDMAGLPFREALYAPRDLDMAVRDADGNYIQQPDPTVPYQNPLWFEATRDFSREGSRTLANVNMSWSPRSWFTASGDIGYDRADLHIREYVPKGTPANVGRVGQLDGEIVFEDRLSEAFNAAGQLTFRRDFGLTNVRTTFRGLLEADNEQEGVREGEDFVIGGVPQLSAIRPEDQEAESLQQDVRALGFLWDTAFDYDGKYILTVLGRRDGSSLFGPANRWHNYYRVAGAWRIGQESWFNVPNINELKLSVARGTAGGRPDFSWQYETWGLSAGIPTKGTLGNQQLAPERTTESEISLSVIAFDRYGLTATYARQRTEDQLNPVPLPAITGYSSQWINAGTIEGHSLEFEFEAQLISRPEFGWTTSVVADYSNATITEWDIPCYAQGWRWNCKNIPVYGIYSRWLVVNREGLNQHDGGSAMPYADEFQVNDEGFLVWVGQGNNYWEGMQKGLWGTESPFTNSVGIPYKWGHPFYERTELGTPHRTLLGEAVPANFGWINNFRWGGFDLHAHLHASIGGQTNNRRFQFMANTTRGTAPFMDQSGKPEGLKKPIAYYRSAIDGDNSYTIEDSSYLKMRTLAIGYRFSQDRLNRWGLASAGITDLRLGLTVRNVFTLTTYDGFDPESGFNLQSRASSDAGTYPPTRSLTADISVTF